MKRARLDKIDKNILRKLQADGRISNIKLSKEVGISAPPCLRRVRALEEAGYIDSYHAHINSSAMGYGVNIFALVTLKSQADEDVVAFQNHISALPMVRDCYLIAGDVDFILRIVAKSWDDYQDVFKNEISSAPNVQLIKSLMTLKTAKNECGVPID